MSDTTSATSEEQKPRKSSALITFFFVLFVLGTVATPIWFFMVKPQIRHEKLVENGIRAAGRLIGVDETGVRVNKVDELELTVEFTRQDGVLDTASTDFLPTSRTIHMYQEGAGVTVAYDLQDPEELTILEISNGPIVAPMVINGNGPTDSLRIFADSVVKQVERMQKLLEQQMADEKK